MREIIMKLYVTMTDKFMSGWGQAANKINKFIVECDSYEQAEAIERAAHNRSEMKDINIRTTEPHYGNGYLESWKSFDELGSVWKGKAA